MAQLSTDTLAYTQIISKVQDFLSKYYRNENNQSIDFDKEYKKLLLEIEKTVGAPMSKLNFFHKGEIPSSEKFNNMTQEMSKDINVMVNQLDALVANYVNSFNQITNYIEEEKTFVNRIRSKINVLELYSNSSSNNITYLGDFFDNLDFVDTTKIKAGYSPEISEGFAALSRKNLKKAHKSISIINQNYNNEQNRSINFVDISNGLKGNYHLYYDDNDPTTVDQYLYEKDTALLKSNVLAMVDESPATYFEYEALKVSPTDGINRPDYEFKFSLNRNRTSLVDWANFDTQKPLKLSLEIAMQNTKGNDINYISIVPFFGYDGIDLIKNIKVSSLKIYDDSTEIPKIYTIIGENTGNEAYIGSDVVASSLSIKKRYFYRKGVFRFEKVKATKVYITLEQSQFNDVSIKHAYWTAYENGSLQNTENTILPWNKQERFNPYGVIIQDQAQDISWDKSSVVPEIERPTEIKSKEIVPLTVKYQKRSTKRVKRIELDFNSSKLYYYGTYPAGEYSDYYIFLPLESAYAFPQGIADSTIDQTIDNISNPSRSKSIICINNSNQNFDEYINSLKNKLISMSATETGVKVGYATFTSESAHNLAVNDQVYIYSDQYLTKGVYKVEEIVDIDTFKVTTSGGNLDTKSLAQAFFIKQQVIPSVTTNPQTTNIRIKTSEELASNNISQRLFLKKNFETLNAKRASIGIRDIFVGMETFADAAEIVSKPFAINGRLDLVSLQVDDYEPVEKNSSGETIGVSKIRYYISVDNGSKWIEISPMSRPFSGVPEVLAFNQNLTTNPSVPQIAYFNSPEVPEEIKSIMFKAVMRKERNVQATPAIYSYRLGIKVV